MSQEIRVDYKQTLMFPPSVEDWVSENHPVRFIREFVDALDIKDLGFKESEGENGRPHYATRMLLGVWVYGYYSKILSTRELEKACMENMGFIWLTWNHKPDHNTLWRFFRDNKKAIRKIFKQSVRVASEASLVGLVLHALDGTKIAAAASNRTTLSAKSLNKALKELDGKIEEIEKQVEAQRRHEGETGWTMPEELADAQTLREAVRTGLEILEKEEVKNLSPVDPQARIMKTGAGNRLAYNAQAVADADSGLIVAGEVVNEQNDMKQLAPMLEQTATVLDGRNAEETLADAGYASGAQIAAAHENEHEILLPLPAEKSKSEFHITNFIHDKENNIVICPMGQTLAYERDKNPKEGNYTLQIYRCKHATQCPRAAECTSDKQGRMAPITPWHNQMRAQLEKQRDQNNRCKLKLRGQTIELVFAGIKQTLGFRRFTLHGLENVKVQWSLVCTAYNLRKLYGKWIKGELAMA